MKKIYLVAMAVLSLIPFISNAQWTSDGSGNYYLNSGYALIGTTGPTSDITYKTEIYGSDHVLGLSGATNGVGQLVGIEFNQLTTAVATRPGGAIKSFAAGSYTGGIGSTYNSDLAFYSAVTGMNTERMRILSNGNVGIGTATPESGFRLDVNGLGAVGTQGSARIYMGTTDATHAVIQSRDNSVNRHLDFYGSSYNFNVGNVGIGTTSPNVPLHISKTGINVTGNLTLLSKFTDPTGIKGISLGYNQSSQAGIIYSENNTGTGSPLEFWTYNGSSFAPRMTFTQAGKLGIGTSSPDELLSVLGTVHANEVKVDLSVPGPDYVFNPDYKLPSLTEVKVYVDKNHHLPEIPSADEMVKNGLNLGEMNTKLLKKVEELTLYLVKENEAKQAQQKEIDELRKQVKTLLKKKS